MRKYPRIRGDVLEVKELDAAAGRYHVCGNLSFLGIVPAIEGILTVRLTGDRQMVIEGKKTIDIRDFGLEPPRILMLRVCPEIRLSGRVTAERID